MGEKTVKESLISFGTKRVINYVDKDPDANIPKVINWLEKHDRQGSLKGQLAAARKYVLEPDSNWWKLVKYFWTDIDDAVRKRLFENIAINAGLLAIPKGHDASIKHDCNIPWAILMDPTSACNLHCTGCWAADYGDKLNLTFEELDSIIKQGKEIGVYAYIFSGGEPLVRKADVIRLCEKHPDCMFLAFTNGTLIDEKFADDMLRVKNFIPAISIEGFEEDTDFRRGKGTYKKVVKAMRILKEKRLPFGASVCYTSRNAEMIGSEEFFDSIIAMGAMFAWVFTYMPVGVDAVSELIATADQREMMYYKVREYRETKPLFTIDFWNDGEYVKGCIAGGRHYLHINANGDIEPCAFIHYSDSNIREKTLLEALKSPLFMEYRKGQPFNENYLQPCPLLDNYGELARMVHASNAYSTDVQNPEDVDSLCSKCESASRHWKVNADKLWRECGKAEEQGERHRAAS
jgi:MoaA/NifB/PqqE/SkfB family radical SAM enzyme